MITDKETAKIVCETLIETSEKFKGTPVATIINGKIKMKNGKILGNPEGKILLFNA